MSHAHQKQGRRQRSVHGVEPLERRRLLSSVVVNTTDDVVYAANSGFVSFRNALQTASSSTTPTTITFDPTVFATPQTITANESANYRYDLDPSEPVTITGPASGLTIDESGVGMSIGSGGACTITGLTFTDGGIANGGTLTLNDVQLTGSGSAGFDNDGTATLSDTTISGCDGAGYADEYDSTGTLTDVTISDNGGSGISLYRGSVDVSDSTISGNTSQFGAGVDVGSSGSATLKDDTITGNTAAATSNGGGGGGIYNAAGTVHLYDTTIAGNSQTGGTGSTPASGGGGLFNNAAQASFTLVNTVVAGNSADGLGPDVYSGFTSGGHNLIGATDNSAGWVSSDLTGTAGAPLHAGLAALANNGGPTLTMLPDIGSPLLGAGLVSAIPAGVTTDQRGAPRTVQGKVDIGAVEVQAPVAAITLTGPAAQSAATGVSQAVTLGSFTATNATAPFTVQVDWGDGSSLTSITMTAAGAIPSTAHTWASTGTDTVTVTVYDAANNASTPVSFAVTVVAGGEQITVTPGESQSAIAGTPGDFDLGQFSEIGATAPYELDVNWGDGQPDTMVPSNGVGVLSPQTHTYASAGTDVVTETVSDSAGHTSAPATFAVTVVPASTSKSTPVVTVTAPAAQAATAEMSQTFTLGTFAETLGTSPYTATINWGDGTAESTVSMAAAGPITGQTHTYATAGTDTVSVTVADAAGVTSTPATFVVTVASAATVTPPPNPSTLVATVLKSTLPASVVLGVATHGTVTVRLANPASALVSGSAFVELTAVSGSTSVLLGTVTGHVKLRLNGTATLTVKVPLLPAALVAGDYTLVADVTDPLLAVATATGPTLSVGPAMVSLALTVPTVTPASARAGKPATVATTLSNGGNVASIGAGTATVTLTAADGTVTTFSPKAIHAKVAPGKKTALRLKIALPAGLAAGSYVLALAVTEGDASASAVGELTVG
jgi:PKD repeat protein